MKIIMAALINPSPKSKTPKRKKLTDLLQYNSRRVDPCRYSSFSRNRLTKVEPPPIDLTLISISEQGQTTGGGGGEI